ncbi:MAG TPA: GNAT family N-acetyltransferase, partial [Candidatus Elarobacter sp.]
IDGVLSGVVLLAFRRDRAWIGGFGVVPEFRRRGLARRYLDETLAIAHASGVASVELEVLTHNTAAVRLYERAGFAVVDEVVVWTREPQPPSGAEDGEARHVAYDAPAIAALARTPAPCWQREPQSVAAAAPFAALFAGSPEAPDAFALVRPGERASVIDARALGAAPASALLGVLDAQFAPYPMALVNEPARGPLHDAFVAHGGWREFGRQYRMRIGLR